MLLPTVQSRCPRLRFLAIGREAIDEEARDVAGHVLAQAAASGDPRTRILAAKDLLTNTGAGGANVWWYEDLMNAVRAAPNSPFKPLPKGADLLVAVRRSIRVGRQAGRPLEELGIAPDHRHHMTRRDLLKANDDLIRKAARILDQKPIYSLWVKPSAWKNGFRDVTVRAGSKIQSGTKVHNIARLDIYVAGRPYKTYESEDGSINTRRLSVKRRRGKNDLLVQAFDRANNLVAAYRHE